MKESPADPNPLIAGGSQELFPQACTIVIFGGAGDLSRRKLIPALYNLALDGLLPTQFAVVGFAIDEMSDDAYRNFSREGIERFSRRPLSEEDWQEFSEHLFYQTGNFSEAAGYVGLKARLEELRPSSIPTVERRLEQMVAAQLAHRAGDALFNAALGISEAMARVVKSDQAP